MLHKERYHLLRRRINAMFQIFKKTVEVAGQRIGRTNSILGAKSDQCRRHPCMRPAALTYGALNSFVEALSLLPKHDTSPLASTIMAEQSSALLNSSLGTRCERRSALYEMAVASHSKQDRKRFVYGQGSRKEHRSEPILGQYLSSTTVAIKEILSGVIPGFKPPTSGSSRDLISLHRPSHGT